MKIYGRDPLTIPGYFILYNLHKLWGDTILDDDDTELPDQEPDQMTPSLLRLGSMAEEWSVGEQL